MSLYEEQLEAKIKRQKSEITRLLADNAELKKGREAIRDNAFEAGLIRGQEEAWKLAIKALKEPERKKGYWEDFDCGNSYRCTSCGEIWTLNDGTPEENNMNYCPKCGANMRGEQE